MTLPLMNIDDPGSRAVPRIALFNLGFRPFFLLAGITAVLLVPLWIFAYTRGQTEFGYYTACSVPLLRVLQPGYAWLVAVFLF